MTIIQTATPSNPNPTVPPGTYANLPTSNQQPAAIAHAIATPDNGITAPPAPLPTTVPVVNVKAPNTTFARYATALFTALITIGSAAQILPTHHTQTDLAQFAILGAGAIGSLFSGISTTSKWPGWLKTGFATLAAVLTVLLPFLANGGRLQDFTATNWIIFGVAAAQAVAVELGVQIRTTANAKVEEDLLK